MKRVAFATAMIIVALLSFLLLSEDSPLKEKEVTNQPRQNSNYGNISF
jgi:hypothetical protein